MNWKFWNRWVDSHGGGGSRAGSFYCFDCGKSIGQRDRKAIKTHGGLKKCGRKPTGAPR